MPENKTTKHDLVDSIYEKTDCEKKTVLEVCDSFLSELKKALCKGNVVELRGFGTFEPRLRKGREKARNPKTGETVSVSDRYTVVFRAGAELKASLRELPV